MIVNKPFFSAQNLTVDLPSLTVSFSGEIEKGEMLGIAGPSGSGKSTILRMTAGLIELKKQVSSHLLLDGRNIINEKPAKRGIGMVFQDPALFSHMRVDDNVAYSLRCAGESKKRSRIEAEKFLEAFGMSGFGPRSPDTLSGGEAQRVSLARTLISKPQLVLFDEPLSSLDAVLRRKLAADIKEYQKIFGFTGIFVSHDIEEIKTMCSKITVIRHGSQIWTGLPQDFSDLLFT